MSNRAFRISFDHEVSKFTIEIQGFLGLRWKPARVSTGYIAPPDLRTKPEGPPLRVIGGQFRKASEVRYFGSYSEARDAVKEMGLDQIYDDFTKSTPWKNHIQDAVQLRQYAVNNQPLTQGM